MTTKVKNIILDTDFSNPKQPLPKESKFLLCGTLGSNKSGFQIWPIMNLLRFH